MKKMVKGLEKIIKNWKLNSVIFTPEMHKNHGLIICWRQ